MKQILFSLLLAASLSAEAQTQTYETEFARPLNEVLTDIQNRFGKFEAPETLGEMTVLTGIAPVSTLRV